MLRYVILFYVMLLFYCVMLYYVICVILYNVVWWCYACLFLFLFFIFLSHSLSSPLSLILLSFLFLSLNFPFSLSLPFLRTLGQTVYSLCVGEPDYQPPAEVITATVRTYAHMYTDTHTNSCTYILADAYTHIHTLALTRTNIT